MTFDVGYNFCMLLFISYFSRLDFTYGKSILNMRHRIIILFLIYHIGKLNFMSICYFC